MSIYYPSGAVKPLDPTCTCGCPQTEHTVVHGRDRHRGCPGCPSCLRYESERPLRAAEKALRRTTTNPDLTGVSPSTICRWELGYHHMPDWVVERLGLS